MRFPEENIEAVAYLFETTIGSTLDETQLNCFGLLVGPN
jgi:hypothetical protein